MGHKIHPTGFRIGVIYDWKGKWFSDKNYTELLHEDLRIRGMINKSLADASISKVDIERNANAVGVTIHTAKPGIVIGRGGAKVEDLRNRLEKMASEGTGPAKRVRVNIQEIRTPELDAQLVARSIADQLQRRVAFRRAMKQSVQRTMQRGAKGIKVMVAGRLGGSEMSRRESEMDGQVPLHTLRADIDYGFAEAHTTFGRIGVKVWIYKGDILPAPKKRPEEQQRAVAGPGQDQVAAPAAPAAPAAIAPPPTPEVEPEPFAAIEATMPPEPAAPRQRARREERAAPAPAAAPAPPVEPAAPPAAPAAPAMPDFVPPVTDYLPS